VRDYYAQFEENVVQAIIDTRIREYEARESAIRSGLLAPNAPFTSVMPPHPLAPNVPPALPPGWESGTPPPMPTLMSFPPPFLVGAGLPGAGGFPFPLPGFPGLPAFPGMPPFPGMPFPGPMMMMSQPPA
jgi:U1 small nuclear ribonucleoprotein C